jgi:hypothetical protein
MSPPASLLPRRVRRTELAESHRRWCVQLNRTSRVLRKRRETHSSMTPAPGGSEHAGFLVRVSGQACRRTFARQHPDSTFTWMLGSAAACVLSETGTAGNLSIKRSPLRNKTAARSPPRSNSSERRGLHAHMGVQNSSGTSPRSAGLVSSQGAHRDG